jgi:hypothetical protein
LITEENSTVDKRIREAVFGERQLSLLAALR